MAPDAFTQEPFQCKLDWGRDGVRRAVASHDVVVIVDILSFSTTVVTAVHHGAVVYPCGVEIGAPDLATRVSAHLAVHRHDVPTRGKYSLSPHTVLSVPRGERIVMPSPNGATCSQYAAHVPHLLIGALVNARATAGVVECILEKNGGGVTVIACGERWRSPGEDGTIRFAIEDYLGAGAILASLPGTRSPEARVCEASFRALKHDVATLLWGCGSGRELRTKGFGDDVHHAAQVDIYDSVPVMDGESFVRFPRFPG